MDTHNRHSHANPSNGQSISKALEQVMMQVKYDYFTEVRSKRIDPLYKDLCLIIAEVLAMDLDSTFKINGNFISVSVVQDVFMQIRNHHIALVFDNFHNVTRRVVNKKAYLRTALYKGFGKK
jgi:hypothetical protein